MSPLVQRGLSVTTEYTDNVLVICSETLSPNDMIQLSRRFRTAKNIEFACEVSESRNNYFDFTTGKNDYISFTAGLLKNQQNTFKTNYPMAMTLTLQKVGFNVIQESISSEEAEDNKLLNRANDIAFKKEEVKNTANARNITKEENDKIVEESKMTKDDEYAHEKFKVAKFLKIKTSDVDEEAVRFKSKFNLKSIVRLAAMDDAANPKSSDEDKARKSVAKVFSHAGITFDSDMTVRVAMKDDTDGVNYKDIYSAIHDERDNLGFIGFSTKSDKLKATDRQMSRFVFDFLKSCGIETSRKDSGKAYELNWHKYAVTALKLSEAKEEVLFEDVA